MSTSQKQNNTSTMVCSLSSLANSIRDQCELLKSEESETNDYKGGYTVFVSATSGVVGLNLFGIFPLILVMCFLLLEA